MKISGFSILLILPIFAQTQSFQSMPDDTTKVRAIHQYIKETRTLSPDTMFTLATEGLDLAKNLNDSKGLAFMSLYQGLSKAYQGKFAEAIPFFDTAVITHLSRKDTLEAGKVLINLGLAYDYTGEMDQALVQYECAAAFLNQVNQPNSRLFHNIAIIYRKQEKYDQAEAFYLKSLALKEMEKDSLGMARTWFNLATLYQHRKDWQLAEMYCRKALDYFVLISNTSEIAAAQTVMGNLFLEKNQLIEAENYLNLAWEYFENHPDDEFFLHTTTDLAALFGKKREWFKAKAFAQLGYSAAEKQNRKPEMVKVAILLSEILEELNDDAEALVYLRRAYQMEKTLTEEKRLSLMEEMQARFEVGQAEYERELQTLAFQQKQKVNHGMLGLLGLIILGILVFLYQKSRNNRVLQSKNTIISQALEEKQALMKEMHHRVKNNLQFISSLLRLQTRHLSDEKAQEALMESRTRVLAMALIHQYLYQNKGVSTIEMNEYLGKLTSELVESLQSPDLNLQLITEVDSVNLDIDQAVPVGLIINELICNAAKYAFPDQGRGELQVSLSQEDNLIKLEVSDNGIGLERKIQENGTSSFGLKLVHLLAEKLKADLNVEIMNGTRFTLTFPKKS